MAHESNIVRSTRILRAEVRAIPPVDLLDLPQAQVLMSEAAGEPTFYWERPDRAEAWLACGSAIDFVDQGPDRIRNVRDAVNRSLAGLQVDGDAPVRPRVVGGFAFASSTGSAFAWREFPAAWFFLPRTLWIRQGERCFVIEVAGGDGPQTARTGLRTPRLAPSAESPDEWRDRVRGVLAHIRGGELEKIVLSRAWHLPGSRPPLVTTLRFLRQARSSCVSFAFKPSSTVLFGSTPELMIRRNGRHFLAPALAGTKRRGRNPAEDRRLAEALLSCPKNCREHDAVVAGIRQALSSLDVVVAPSERPRVVTLPEALHLQTPVSGHASAGCDALALAAALHPTPAVCGTPRTTAARLLQEMEANRGWYTGAIGWMDAAGDGEIDVVLRSALADGPDLTLFAGAGIVNGSQPDTEFEETELKMSAMLAPIREAAGAPDVYEEVFQEAVPV